MHRTSSASEYSAYREHNLRKHCLSSDLLGPIVMSPIISLDDWVPERPPKNPSLRIPSPDLPPPPPLINHQENELIKLNQDEPLPPPPPELMRSMRQLSETKFNAANRRNSFAGSTTRRPFLKTNNFDNLSPPLLPRKPAPMELFNQRPFSSMRQPHGFQVTQSLAAHQKLKQPQQQKQQTQQSHKVVLNGKFEQQQTNGINKSPQAGMVNRPAISNNDSRVSMRKRTHNAPVPFAERQSSRYQSQALSHNQLNEYKTPTTSKSHGALIPTGVSDAEQRTPITAENRIR